MSKFKELFETVLAEYDRDDPSDNFWQAAKDYKNDQMKKNTIYSKPIKPLTLEDKVYIKAINTEQFGSYRTNEMYLTNRKDFPYCYSKEKAFKFPLSQAEEFVNNHPKQTVDKTGNPYEVHFELEKA